MLNWCRLAMVSVMRKQPIWRAVFAETGEPRENAADALDQTPFLDDLGVAITTAPEFLAWTE